MNLDLNLCPSPIVVEYKQNVVVWLFVSCREILLPSALSSDENHFMSGVNKPVHTTAHNKKAFMSYISSKMLSAEYRYK